jgi:hypothetical protein
MLKVNWRDYFYFKACLLCRYLKETSCLYKEKEMTTYWKMILEPTTGHVFMSEVDVLTRVVAC